MTSIQRYIIFGCSLHYVLTGVIKEPFLLVFFSGMLPVRSTIWGTVAYRKNLYCACSLGSCCCSRGDHQSIRMFHRLRNKVDRGHAVFHGFGFPRFLDCLHPSAQRYRAIKLGIKHIHHACGGSPFWFLRVAKRHQGTIFRVSFLVGCLLHATLGGISPVARRPSTTISMIHRKRTFFQRLHKMRFHGLFFFILLVFKKLNQNPS